MKPAPFTYHRPRTEDEVDALLSELGSDAKILAGGQSLIPILNMRLGQPAHLIDVNRLENAASEPLVSDGWVTFGPTVRQSAAEHSDEVARHVPLLTETMEYVAHPAIRNRGTITGSIAHADPAAELPAVFAVLEGEVVARGSGGRRTIPASGCFAGPLENACEPTEWISEVRFPVRGPGQGFAFEEFARRSGDYALCGVAASARRQGDGIAIALAYLGMGDTPVRFELPPLGPNELDELTEQIDELVRTKLDASEDVHATPAYREWLARSLGMRAARRAAEGAWES